VRNFFAGLAELEKAIMKKKTTDAAFRGNSLTKKQFTSLQELRQEKKKVTD
jgi:hypothetical protein